MADSDASRLAAASSVLVGVLSDTHGVLPAAAFAELADCDAIVHAGDICDPDILSELATLAFVTAVLGNNDCREYGEAVDVFAAPVFGGVRFLVTHTPEDARRALLGCTSALQPGDPIPQVVVHGHTHVPRILKGKAASPARLVVCPGSVSRPRGGSAPCVAKISIEDGAVCSARLVELEA